MSDLQSSIGIHQMRKLDEMQTRREEIAIYTIKHLIKSPDNNSYC